MDPSAPRAVTALALIGVAGCGKTTVASLVAQQLGWMFVEGDDLHPQANVRKMRSGIPLDDADRAGWLAALSATVATQMAQGRSVVFTCSALRQRYRQALRAELPDVRMVHLRIDIALARVRVGARRGHLFPASLVESQFAAWEPADGEPLVWVLDGTLAVPILVDAVVALIRSDAPSAH
jgi:gluconokinase